MQLVLSIIFHSKDREAGGAALNDLARIPSICSTLTEVHAGSKWFPTQPGGVNGVVCTGTKSLKVFGGVSRKSQIMPTPLS